MVKLLSAAPALAVAALLAGASGASAASARALLAESTAPAPASAPMPMAKSSAPAPDMTLSADGVSFANGKLVIKDPSETIIKRNGDAIGLATTATTFGPGTKLNAPSTDAVVLGVTDAGMPVTAIAKLSNPVLTDDSLTFDAVIMGKPAASDGAVAATAAKAKSLVSPDAKSFSADTAAIVFDGAPAADVDCQKGIVGAVVGAGVGGALCGPWCAAGGAIAGSWW